MLTEQEIEGGCEILDGYVVNADGEVLRLAQKPPFQANTREAADWVLGKMAEQEGQLVAIDRRRKALLANLEQQHKAAASRLRWLHERFDADLEQFARQELAGGKAKTLVLDHGRISFRQSKGTNRITDMARAVAWMRTIGHADRVKVVESVTATDLAELRGGNELPFLETTGPRETVTIAPGVSEG